MSAPATLNLEPGTLNRVKQVAIQTPMMIIQGEK